MLRARWWTVTASGAGMAAAAVTAAVSNPGTGALARPPLPTLAGLPAPVWLGLAVAAVSAISLWLRLPPLRWWNGMSAGAVACATAVVAGYWLIGRHAPILLGVCVAAAVLVALGCRSVPIGPGEPGVLRVRRRTRTGAEPDPQPDAAFAAAEPARRAASAAASSAASPSRRTRRRRRNSPAHSPADAPAPLQIPLDVPAPIPAPTPAPMPAPMPDPMPAGASTAAPRPAATVVLPAAPAAPAAPDAEHAALVARVRSAEERAAAAEARALAAEARAAAQRADAADFAAAITAAAGTHGLVGGRWRLLAGHAPLGAGRFGVVLAVEPAAAFASAPMAAPGGKPERGHVDTQLPAVAALKVLRTDTGDDTRAVAEFRTRLLREVDVLRGLDHPCVARLHDGGIDAALGHPFLVMDLYPGGTLDAANVDSVATATRLRLMADVFEALAYLHARPTPIVHRDVKPANVLLQARMRRAVLCDFGIARLQDVELTRLTRGISPHTPYFAAPEQVLGDVERPVDVHAAGACAFWLLCGEPPYRTATEARGAGPAEWGRLAAEGAVTPGTIAARRPDLVDTMPDVVALLDATLRFDPAARPSAADVATALRRQAAPPPPPPPAMSG